MLLYLGVVQGILDLALSEGSWRIRVLGLGNMGPVDGTGDGLKANLEGSLQASSPQRVDTQGSIRV